jgi:hypothetical protein
MTLERIALLAMGLGLVLVGQPWAHPLFMAGFPVILAGVAAYGIAGALGKGGREEGP